MLYSFIGRSMKWTHFIIALKLLMALKSQLIITKTLTMCELAQELDWQGLDNIQYWVCLANVYSNYTTTANEIESRHGILGILEPTWCTENKNGGKCGLKCSDMRDENLNDDVYCALLMHKELGFGEAWPLAKESCTIQLLPQIGHC